jgi:sugar phosphate isomerase/epimerase
MAENDIYISTSAFSIKQLDRILEECACHTIRNIELSASLNYYSSYRELLNQYRFEKGFRFLIHNYFPIPASSFVLNLASNQRDILRISREHCNTAIDLCAELEIPFYSVHTGFCFNAGPEDLGKNQTNLQKIPKHEAKQIFVESIQMVSEYAENKNIKIAIENNVVAPFNLVDGKNELLLGVRSEELLELFEMTGKPNLFFLLDVGHLKISAHSLGFDPRLFIREVSEQVIGVHLSDNNFENDTHDPVSEAVWFWEPIRSYLTENIYFTLETKSLPVNILKEQVGLIKEQLFL